MKADLQLKIVNPQQTKPHHILLVDDNLDALRVQQMVLERLGYHLTAMDDSVKALRLFARRPNAVDMIITDLFMPNLDGIHFSKRVLSIRPAVPIMLCSGYISSEIREEAQKIGIREILEKPIHIKTLEAGVKRGLAQPYQPSAAPIAANQY